MTATVARIGALRPRTFYRTRVETYYQAEDGRTWLVAQSWRPDAAPVSVDPAEVPGNACPVRYAAAEERLQRAADLLEAPPEERAAEAKLEERDARVAKALRAVITRHRSRADELRAELAAELAAATAVEDAVREERWYDLDGYLDDADVESLCAVSPSGLLDEDA